MEKMPRKNKKCTRKAKNGIPRRSRILISSSEVEIEYGTPNSLFPTVEKGSLSIVEEIRTGILDVVKIFLKTAYLEYELVRGTTLFSRPDNSTLILSNPVHGTRVKLVFPSGARLCNRFQRVLNDCLGTAGNEIAYASATGPRVKGSITPLDCNDYNVSLYDALVGGSKFIAESLVSGAESVSSLIDDGTPSLIDNITPEERPADVDPTLQVGLKVAKGFTQAVAVETQLTSYAVTGIVSSAGQFLAPHIRKLGTEVLTSDYDYSVDEAEKTVDKAMEVTAGVATGIATIFDGFMSAFSILGESISRNAVEVVKHKYGDAAADATNDAFGIVGNVASSRMNKKRFQKKGIAVEAAKQMYSKSD